MPTNAERMKAKRIRAKGPSAMDNDDRTWLSAYERSITRARQNGKRAKPPTSPEAPASDASPTQTPAPAPAPAPTQASVPEGHTVIDFGSPAPGPAAAPAPGTPQMSSPTVPTAVCNIKDCPKCKNVRGSQTCAVTHERVWPPMTIESSEGMAKMIFWLVGTAIRYFRPDRQYVEPTAAEVRLFGMALREFSYRRASWIGAFDDIVLLAVSFGGYARRAYTAPAMETRPETVAEQVARAESMAAE